jgi:hypothetical protein
VATAFQPSAFQSSPLAFQIAVAPIVVVDTHDGDLHRKKRFDDERQKSERSKADVLKAFERLIEGKVDVEEVIPKYVTEPKVSAKAQTPRLDIDRLMADFNAVEALWEAYMEMDDMDALRALGLQ